MSAIFAPKTMIAGPTLSPPRVQAPLLAAPDGILRTWVRSYRRHRAFMSARAELMALDDRMLRDIGLDRSEITSALLDSGHERNGRLTALDRLF